LKFAEEFLVEKCEEHPEMPEKLEKTFALLAFDKPESSPFASLMELSHRQMVEESLKFAEEFLVEKCEEHPEMPEKLEKTFALLAFDKPESSPFASLMELSHRQMVATDVNSAVLKALHKPAAPRIEALFPVMVWSHQQLVGKDDAPEPPDALNKLFADE
uniref:CRA domain-containing protein n=1 Tax=Toxocara canis TaxID=6265 RepID=A0A183VH91_TOXCA